MSLLRPRPNRRLDRCQFSPFSIPISLSLSLSLSRILVSFSSSFHLSSSFSLSLRNISLRISAPGSHGKQCTARRPRKHPLLLSRRRERERGKEGQRGQSCYPSRFGNLFPRPKALSAPIRERVPSLSNFPDTSHAICGATIVYLLDVLNLSNNIKFY